MTDLLDQVNIKSCVKVEIDQEILLKNFSILVDHLKNLSDGQIKLVHRVGTLEKDKDNIEQRIKTQKDECDKKTIKLEQLDKIKNSLEGAIKDVYLTTQQVSQTRDMQYDNKNLIKSNKSEIDKLWAQIQDMQKKQENQNKKPQSSNNNRDMLPLLESLQAEIQNMNNNFVQKQEYNEKTCDYEKRIKELEENVLNLQKNIGNYDIDYELETLKNQIFRKGDKSWIEKEIIAIKQYVTKMVGMGSVNQTDTQATQNSEMMQYESPDTNEKIQDIMNIISQLRSDVDSLQDDNNLFIQGHVDPHHYSEKTKNQNSTQSQNYQKENSNDGSNQYTRLQQKPRKNQNNESVDMTEDLSSVPFRPENAKKLSFREVINITSQRHQSKLKVDQNRELIEQLKKQVLKLEQNQENLKFQVQSGIASNNSNQNTENLENNINNSQPKRGSQQIILLQEMLSSQISELGDRLDELQNKVRDKGQQTDLDMLRFELDKIDKGLNENNSKIQRNSTKISQILQSLSSKGLNLNDSINEGSVSLKLGKVRTKLSQNNNVNNDDANERDFSSEQNILNINLDDKSRNFDQKLKNLKDYLIQLLKALKNDIDSKPVANDLQKLETFILEKLDQVAGALITKLADKADTKKALKHLENKLYLMLAKDTEEHNHEEDALVVKRPLLWSCISCDKQLDKYNGKLGDYKAWGMMPPKETSPDRLGKFGRGWKEQIDKKQMVHTDMGYPQSGSTTDQTQSAKQLPKLSRQRNQSYSGRVIQEDLQEK